MQSATIIDIAESLAKSRYRFITDMQIGALRRKYGASRDEIRSAAILADRLRRQRQIDEQLEMAALSFQGSYLGGNGKALPCFTVAPLIPPDAPIALPKEQRRRKA
ncbi:hypothetical protein ACC680_26895 [Rhizobium ruizarguesonis]